MSIERYYTQQTQNSVVNNIYRTQDIVIIFKKNIIKAIAFSNQIVYYKYIRKIKE